MQRRIVTLAVLTAVLATVVFGVPLAVVAHRDALDHEVAEARDLAADTALEVAPSLATRNDLPDLSRSPEADLTIALYDGDGRRLAGRGPDTADSPARDAVRLGDVVTDEDAGGEIVVAVPVTVDGRVLAVTRAATPRAEVTHLTLTAWGVLGLLAAGAVLIGGLVARGLARRLTRPLEALAAGAHRLGDGDFSVRSDPSGIPELDEVGGALDATATRLGDLVARERSFAGRASHQLRTPLTGLRLHLERALTCPPADRTRALQDALQATDRLEGTVHDLLALTRETRSVGGLDVPRLVAELADTWAPILARSARHLDARCEPGLPATPASPAAVRQVLTVLLDNATCHGSGDVLLNARDAGGLLALDVTDEGGGEAAAERVRRGLTTSAGASDRLGLPLARSLADAEGARLRLSGTRPLSLTLVLPPAEDGTGEPPAR
ncbi:HAMP domain-containing sensor histidine kinase [Blastococcus sp. URHD0036]|uniref:sensor histidine kinase n=1 Tax=Blastococcus sp. URHD0036 TaxID=1380356 RepID=UPI0004969528|nr:HAMP domain-containing sensor histidine kinase [Blastococcus sp. URHD0036]